MMGQLPAGQSALFYDFCLDDYIPQDHCLRQIDRFLDLSELRGHLAPFYSHTGRPSIDPESLIACGYDPSLHNLPLIQRLVDGIIPVVFVLYPFLMSRISISSGISEQIQHDICNNV